jgi:hypothetical protein
MTRTRSTTVGLALLGLLSLIDTASILLTDGEFPPFAIAAIGTALGVVSLVLVALGWRGSRAALGWLVGLRLLSAASALPAFVVAGVPAPVRAVAAAGVLVTLLGCALLLPGLRRTPSREDRHERAPRV